MYKIEIENKVKAFERELSNLKSDKDTEILTRKNLYRLLFENSLDGFAFCRMIFENNDPVDLVYLEVNQAFE